MLAATGRAVATAVPMTAAESLGYPTGPAASIPDGTIVRDPRGTTWLVTGGARAKAGAPVWAALGRPAPRLHPVTDAELTRLPVVDPPASPLLRDGTLVQTWSHKVGVVSGGTARRLHDSRQVRDYGYAGKPRLVVPDAVVAHLRTSELTATARTR